MNDAAESSALARVFGACPPNVVSTKQLTGHLLGAAGITEAVFAMWALARSEAPASLGQIHQTPPCHSARPSTSRLEAGIALSNSFAFGGNNISLAFGMDAGMSAGSFRFSIHGAALWVGDGFAPDASILPRGFEAVPV